MLSVRNVCASMPFLDYCLFLLFVALATYAQTMTGFAFGLVLLGLSGMFNLAPLPMVSNVVSILTLVNLTVSIGRTRPQVDWKLLMPALLSSLFGIAFGVFSLRWVGHDFAVGLHWLLGLTIVVCAFMLVNQARRRKEVSGRPSFLFFGTLSGVLSGLFSSGGPPIVYHLYRQPLPVTTVRNTLLIFFAFTAAARLLLVTLEGAIDTTTLMISAGALPVVIVLTWLVRRYANMESAKLVRRLVFILLVAAGVGLLIPSSIELLRIWTAH